VAVFLLLTPGIQILHRSGKQIACSVLLLTESMIERLQKGYRLRAHSKIHAPGRGEKISRDILEKVDRKIEIVNNGLL
jgi:hypothetical protein